MQYRLSHDRHPAPGWRHLFSGTIYYKRREGLLSIMSKALNRNREYPKLRSLNLSWMTELSRLYSYLRNADELGERVDWQKSEKGLGC
ncbi:hypothetical protein TNIN_43361 [Trichonephila inaurata madagascariensis]|uniref:Uncharacterized protein n=1 Tax=Trichonephila inaurata madagascariensis TaxID=2747483 RepID=A0A8X6YPZ1_9ARAC|nr:hypothetical protein TNIN_43361 [Trichonephila inaurata madagascariensis]